MVRITTWNVNGIRNPFGYKPWSTERTFNAMFDILETDIVVMQELKIQRKDLTDDMVLVPGWDCYFSLPKHKKGYSGVGIYTRQAVCAPIRAEEGLLGVLCPPSSSTPYRELPKLAAIGGYPSAAQLAGIGDIDPLTLDAEGRCLVLEFPAFVLFGVYSPANSNGLRDDFRLGFLAMLDARIRNLVALGKNVILTGDLNVSRDLIDTAKAEDNMRSEGMTHDEYLSTPNRRIFNQLILNSKVPGNRDAGRERPVLYDLCREFNPDREGMYTHWEQKINARPGNFGSRIDFILCSIAIKDWFKEADIQEGLVGSDHCPVYTIVHDTVHVACENNCNEEHAKYKEQRHILDLLNPPGMFEDGVRKRAYDISKDIPALSGRLLPEFTKRRNIRDMFNKKSAVTQSTTHPGAASSAGYVAQLDEDAKRTPQISNHSDNGTAVVTKLAATVMRPHVSAPIELSKSPEKRRASASLSPAKPLKRGRSNLATATTSTLKGQQSLSGFLKPRANAMTSDASLGLDVRVTSPEASCKLSTLGDTIASPIYREDAFDKDPRASQEASKESWTKLFSKKPVPRCEHGDPCQILTTKKPGVNNGRQFYMCARPIGPSGQKETGTQWRCGTFIWSSDWKGT